MKIKRTNIDIKIEKDFLTGCIIDTQFIKEIQPIYNKKFINSPFVKTVAEWCNEYYQQYKEAPKNTIQDIFESKKRNGDIKENQEEIISEFLSNLSDEYEATENFNSKYILNEVEIYFKKRKLEELIEDIKASILAGDIAKSESEVSKFKRVSRPMGEGIDILRDEERIIKLLNEESDDLFSLPGELGKALGPFCRGDLIAVAAPPKRGKSWWLQEIGLRGLWAKYKVLFVSLEMTESQMTKRIYQSILGATIREENDPIILPYFDEEGNIQKKEVHKKSVSSAFVNKKGKAISKMVKGGKFRLLCFPAYSANVEDIEQHLYNMENYENFSPDIIIFDYADILAPEKDSPKDYRHRLDHTWKCLRALAQKRNCLIATATQTGRATFSRDAGQGDMAEDNRKIAHVSCMFAINQDSEDRDNSAIRIRILANRHDHFSTDDDILVLQQLKIGKPYLYSKKVKKKIKKAE